MSDFITNNVELFINEANDLLASLEDTLLALENAPTDAELIKRVFRTVHTIKGSGAMFGFDAVSEFTHEIETVLDCVRSGKVPVTSDLIDLTLASRDIIQEMIEEHTGGDKFDRQEVKCMINGFRDLIPGSGAVVLCEDALTDDPEVKDNQEKTYRIRFTPGLDVYSIGLRPERVLDELRGLGICSVYAKTETIPGLHQLDSESCYIKWDIILSTDAGLNAIRDAFIFFEGHGSYNIEPIQDICLSVDDEDSLRIGEILIQRGDINEHDLERAIKSGKPLGDFLAGESIIRDTQLEAALIERDDLRTLKKDKALSQSSATVRVPSERLDGLVNLIGELVTVQEGLRQIVGQWDDLGADTASFEGNNLDTEVQNSLTHLSEQLDRVTDNIREKTMDLRMVPINLTFCNYMRLVRDMSKDLKKELHLVTEGGETELDKNVIEKLNEPLVHIIRNCIDHGIESPEERLEKGKPSYGTIKLEAEHEGSHVVIRITDDGRGIDCDLVAKRALEAGHINTTAGLSDEEKLQLIFIAGLSTAGEVTDISGRGVGMDVVKKSIDALHGSIKVDNSEGNGTVITLKIPITLAIIDGLLITIGEGHYVFPLSQVEECFAIHSDDLIGNNGSRQVKLRGDLIPYIPLRSRFNVAGDEPEYQQIVVTRFDDARIGFVVDSIVGHHQTVIKSMSSVYKDLKHISGATILGNGTVSLILDTKELIRDEESLSGSVY
jgi:two-component system chemotaxis sensor kinase CheA